MYAHVVVVCSIWSSLLAVQTNTSGLADIDYPSLEGSLPTLGSLTTVVPLRHTPLPPELLQEFQSIHTLQ